MNHIKFKEARRALGLTQKQMAAMLDSDPLSIRRMEMAPDKKSSRDLPPRAERLIQAYLDGWRPADWPEQQRED
jgi:ribosome-binding protein aMBF1 (putative translation factor)